MTNFYALLLFNLLVLFLLALDLGVFNRRPHPFSWREALLWSAFWIGLSLAFAAGVYYWRGPQAGLEFLTAYLLEKSLSTDNVLVFSVIFSTTAVPSRYQHRVLFWGVLGALVTRGAFIAAGVALIRRFDWILYLFGAFLGATGAVLLASRHKPVRPERNPIFRLARRFFPVTSDYEGGAFFVRQHGRLFATPLFLALLMVETTDVVFATDSVPAVLAVTADPFIVYASNVLAILGLRALYFLLAGAMGRFRYLRTGVALVLMFVGAKMLLANFYRIPTWQSLLFIAGMITVTIMVSLRYPNGIRPASKARRGES